MLAWREYYHTDAIHLRGQAHLRLRHGPEAAVEFRRILDHKGSYWGTEYILACGHGPRSHAVRR